MTRRRARRLALLSRRFVRAVLNHQPHPIVALRATFSLTEDAVIAAWKKAGSVGRIPFRSFESFKKRNRFDSAAVLAAMRKRDEEAASAERLKRIREENDHRTTRNRNLSRHLDAGARHPRWEETATKRRLPPGVSP